MTVHAVIAEDEPELAEYLRRRLLTLWPELVIDGIAADGIHALELIEACQPQVAFLDIKMPGLTGLEVAERISGTTRVVFVTAYDEFAVQAFEQAAIDYLVKPVGDERLARCIARLTGGLGAAPAADLAAVLQQLLKHEGRADGRWLQWIRAGLGNTIRQIPIDRVIYFAAADKYTRVVCADSESLVRVPIKDLEPQLDPRMFARIHRSTIVNLRCVERLHRSEIGRLELHLAGRSEVLAVSRAYAGQFRQM